MDSWLTAGLVAVSNSSALLSLTYLFLFYRYRQAHLLAWGCAWGMHLVRNLCILANISIGGSLVLLVAEQWAVLATASLLLLGAQRFLGRPFPRPLAWILGLVVLWPPAAALAEVPKPLYYIPTYTLLGAMQITAGLALLRGQGAPRGWGKRITAFSLIIWGVHQLDYPFLRHVAWIAPWGFQLGAVLALTVAIGMIVLFFERLRAQHDAGEQRLRTILETARDGFMVTGPQDHILEVNEAYCKMTGYTRAELIGRHMSEIDAVMSAGDMQDRRGILEESGSDRVVSKLLRKDGRIIDAELSARLLPDGEGTVAVFVRDITEKNRADEALRASEQRFRTLTRVAPVGIFQADASGRCSYVNDHWAAISGYPKENALGRGWLRTLRPEDRAVALHGFRESARSGQDFVTEFSFQPLDERPVWFLMRATPEMDATGRFLGFVGAIIDISQRKAAEQALAEERGILNGIIEGTSDIVFVKDREGCYSRVNSEAARVIGRSLEEIIGHDDSELFPPEEAESIMQADREIMASGMVRSYEENVTTASGRRTYLVAKGPLVNEAGVSVGLFGISRDITERVQAESAFRNEYLRRNILMETSPDGILIINHDHQVIECNLRFAQMLGYSREELLGMHTWEFEDIMGEADIRKNFTVLERVSKVFESRHRRKDGSTYEVEVGLSGGLIGGEALVFAVCRDITARREGEIALMQAKDAAEAANRAKSVFLANMSHEIRTPLNGLLGMLQLIKTSDASEEVRLFAEMAQRSGNRLTHLLNDILDLSRIEAGRLPLVDAPFAVAELVNSLAETFSPTDLSKNVRLTIETGPGVPAQVAGDVVRVRQVLFNLVGNAMKFTSQGSVRVGVSKLMPLPDGRARLLFTVCDSGMGIPAERLGDICQPFTQVAENYSRSQQGAGLGLSIVRNLVLAMGGGMCFDSELGAGTCVGLMLPFGQVECAPEAAAMVTPCLVPGLREVEPGGPGGSKRAVLRLLLVEDEEIGRMSARVILERMGHMVSAVPSARLALELLAKADYDCVLMDVQMEGMDGLEATRRIRAGEAGSDRAATPVIAMTAYAMTGDRERFLAAGMDDYIPKPVQVEDLERALERLQARSAG